MNEIKLLFRKDLFILINNIKLILKNPLRLLPYIFVLGYFSFFYFRRTGKSAESVNPQDLEKLQEAVEGVADINYKMVIVSGALTFLALSFLIFQLFKATKKNVSFFSMADVNYLFTAPASPANILVYYMIRSLLPAIGGSIFFMIYASSQLLDTFDLEVWQVCIMAIGLALFIFILSPIKFLVYTLHTKYDILGYFKTGVFSLGIILGLMILVPGLMAEKFWQGMFLWIASPWFDFFPLIGWSRAILTFAGHQNIWIVIGFISVYALTFFMILKLVLVHSGYYYEDVLDSTQSNEEVKEKVKGNSQASESTMSLNTKKQLDLANFGFGGKALYWRNYVHSSRQDFHPLFGLYGLILSGIGIVFAVLSRFDWFAHQVIYFYLLILIFIYFFAGMGRNNVGDLKKPFFILIPASWSSKFWNMIKLDVMQTLIFATILIIPTVLIASLSLWLIPTFIFCLVAFYLSGFALTLCTNVGFDEGWDRKLIKPVLIIGVLMFGILPAIAAGIFVFIVSKQFALGMLGISLGMLFVTAVMLHVAMDLVRKVEFKEL